MEHTEQEVMRGIDRKDRWKRGIMCALILFAGLALAILFFFLIFRLPSIKGWFGELIQILSPFVYGAILAYLLTPAANYVEGILCKVFRIKDKHQSRANGVIRMVGVVTAFLFAVCVIYVLLMMVIPQASLAITEAIDLAPKQYDKVIAWVTKTFDDNPKILDWIRKYGTMGYDYALDWLEEHMIPNITEYIGGVTGGIVTVLRVVGNLLIGVIVAIYLLLSRARFAKQANLMCYSLFPKNIADKVVEEVKFTDKTFNGFINGKLLDSMIIFLITYVGCLILKIPYAILMAVIVGVTNLIPFFGPFIGLVPCALILVIFSPVKCLYFVIFNLILQQVDGNIINPKIVGDSTGLNAFWVLFSITLFGGFFGIVGIFIGVPVFAVIYHWCREIVQWGLKKRGMDEVLTDYLNIYDDQRKKREKQERRREQFLQFKNKVFGNKTDQKAQSQKKKGKKV